jgi:hypothetical protein
MMCWMTPRSFCPPHNRAEVTNAHNQQRKKTMTTLEIQAVIGKRGLLAVEKGFAAVVTVEDGRTSFGRAEFQVKDVNTGATAWVQSDRVKLAK